MEEYADDEYSSGVYGQYVQARNLKLATFRARIEKIHQRAPGTELLDLGCSCGYFLEAASEAGFSVRGVEFSSQAIAAAAEHVRERIIQGDINKLATLGLGSNHVVTAFDIIEHSSDPARFLTDIADVLKPGGLLVVSTPDAGHFLRRLMGSRWPMLQPLQHTVLFTRESLRLLLQKSGYHDIEVYAARKVLTADYLMGQISIYNPSIVRAYNILARGVPMRARQAPLSVNIGELIATARR